MLKLQHISVENQNVVSSIDQNDQISSSLKSPKKKTREWLIIILNIRSLEAHQMVMQEGFLSNLVVFYYFNLIF